MGGQGAARQHMPASPVGRATGAHAQLLTAGPAAAPAGAALATGLTSKHHWGQTHPVLGAPLQGQDDHSKGLGGATAEPRRTARPPAPLLAALAGSRVSSYVPGGCFHDHQPRPKTSTATMTGAPHTSLCPWVRSKGFHVVTTAAAQAAVPGAQAAAAQGAHRRPLLPRAM